MPGGGQIGNQNARKRTPQTAEEKREYQRLAMQKRRALLRGDIKQAYQFVGRPRRKIVKGDIFDVAVKLYNELKKCVGDNYQLNPALQAWRDYWEND